MSEEKTMTRRTFVDWLLSLGLVAWVVGFVSPVIAYVWPAQQSGPSEQAVSAGKVDDFKDWTSAIVAVNGHPVIVIRTPEGFRAFSAICTHLGCIVEWNEQKRLIACPCHAGVFNLNGQVVSGPPPRPLPEESVAVVNNEVMVKLS